MNKFLIGVASVAMLAAPLAASAQSFGHGRGDYGRGDYGRGGYDRDGFGGGAVAAGVAGLVIGSALANSTPYGYGPAYGYAPAYYGPHCFWQAQPYRTYYGGVAYQQVKVCR